ncbi:hypothetical protein [Pyxidicoccus xibeiensis]|uniref:hypothetical protein n=1 Tax=Pyxidicoccus xibeiensis TaxID=2906759 RepID=UPI0020A81438|nr:hypothetical protein [Pyxidicoccus xibeiensis]MCP3136029.1 hypothetical protein [Pyxidicoccus xibeiensis]
MELAPQMVSSQPRQVVRTVLREALESQLGGEVVVKSSTLSGRIFVVARKVAWAAITGPGATNFASMLIHERRVSREDLQQVMDECRKSGGNFCETLVAWDLLPRDSVRELLRRHLADQLEALLALKDAQALFVTQPRAYSSQLTFSIEELALPFSPTAPLLEENIDMANVKQCLEESLKIDGAFAACLVDAKSGMSLGSIGGNATFNVDAAAAGNTEVVRAKLKTMNALGIKDRIEDILITLGEQYHVIRPLSTKEGLFLYLALHRANANLAMARFKLADIEKSLTL